MFEHLESADTSELELNNMDGSPMVYVDKDGNEHRAKIIVRSRTSEAIRHLNNTIQRRRMKEQAEGKQPDIDQQERDGAERLETIIAGWENLPDGNGGTIKFSREAARNLAEHPKLDYIHRQIFAHHAKDENFMQT